MTVVKKSSLKNTRSEQKPEVPVVVYASLEEVQSVDRKITAYYEPVLKKLAE